MFISEPCFTAWGTESVNQSLHACRCYVHQHIIRFHTPLYGAFIKLLFCFPLHASKYYVYETIIPFPSPLQILPWPTRLRHATEMASLLQYLEFSPLGSLVVPDFKEGHLIMVNDSLKLIDLDDVNNVEPECGLKNPSDECPYKMRY